MMKILTAIVKTLMAMLFVGFVAVIIAFFVTVFKPDGVLRAIEIIKSLM